MITFVTTLIEKEDFNIDKSNLKLSLEELNGAKESNAGGSTPTPKKVGSSSKKKKKENTPNKKRNSVKNKKSNKSNNAGNEEQEEDENANINNHDEIELENELIDLLKNKALEKQINFDNQDD